MTGLLDDFIPNDVAGLRQRMWPIIQTTAAATAAWQLSRWLLPGSAPTYAILAVVTGMNVHPGNRGKWMLQVTLGAVLGVLVANVVGYLPAPLSVRILVAVLLALTVGVLFFSQNWFLINAAAGAVTPLAQGSVGHGFSFTVGWQALIACGVALVVTQLLFPADAAGTARIDLRAVLSAAAATLRSADEQLSGGAELRTDSALDRRLDARVSSLHQSLQSGRQITRLAPRRLGQRAAVARYSGAERALARLAADVGGLGRLAGEVGGDGGSGAVGDDCRRLADALGGLVRDVDDPARQDAAASCAAQLVERAGHGGGGGRSAADGRRRAAALLLRDAAADTGEVVRALRHGRGTARLPGGVRDAA